MATSRFLLLATALALVLGTAPVRATQVLQQDLRDLTLGSSDILVGQIESTRAVWDGAHTRILTEVTVRVDESLMGAAAGPLTLTQLGGELDGWRYEIEGSPLFRPGQEALLFVWRDAQGRAQVNGLAQGKFDITTDPATGEKLVQRAVPGLQVRDLRTLSLVRPGARAPRLALDDMKHEIRRILEEAGR